MTSRRCCCGATACDPDSFSCPHLTGRVNWRYRYQYDFNRLIEATLGDCGEWPAYYGNCADPGAELPGAWAEQRGEWTGYIRLETVSLDDVENIVDMPQTLAVSDPPTDAELCEIAKYEMASSAGSCTIGTHVLAATSTLAYEGITKYGWGGPPDYPAVGWYGFNGKVTATIEARLVSQPDMTFDATIRQRVPAYYECLDSDPLNAICSDDVCYLDAVYHLGMYEKLQFRCLMTWQRFDSTDLTQSTPVEEYSHTGDWTDVLGDLEDRRLYQGMINCDDPTTPSFVHPMRPNNESESVSGFTNELRRVLNLVINAAWVDVGSNTFAALFMSDKYAPLKTAANVSDMLMRRDTSSDWYVADDDQSMGSIDQINRGDFKPILGCGMMLYYDSLLSPVNEHVRTVTLEIDWDLEPCAPPLGGICDSVTNDGDATESLAYGFSSEPTLVSIVAEDCT